MHAIVDIRTVAPSIPFWIALVRQRASPASPSTASAIVGRRFFGTRVCRRNCGSISWVTFAESTPKYLAPAAAALDAWINGVLKLAAEKPQTNLKKAA